MLLYPWELDEKRYTGRIRGLFDEMEARGETPLIVNGNWITSREEWEKTKKEMRRN